MGIDRQKTADQILQAIEFGNLPRDEIERRLNWIIDNELSGSITSHVDSNMIDLCNSLLLQLQTHGKVSFTDNAEMIKKVVAEKYESWKQKSSSVKTRVRYAAAFVVLVIIMSLPAILPSIRWQNKISTPDEQQYIIEGHEITTQTVAHAIESHNGSGSLITASKEEVDTFLGYKANLPSKVIDIYTASKYYTTILPERIDCLCEYAMESGSPAVRLKVSMYNNINDMYVQLEQLQVGKSTKVGNVTVYCSENINSRNYTWIQNNEVFVLSLNHSNEDAIHIISELNERE